MVAKTAENLCLGFGCREGKEFCKGLILLFSQKQKTKNSNLKFVIPAQAGIQCVEFQLFRINFETLIASFPRKLESSFLSFSHSR
ncbi:hypothetical protein A6J51_13705 [Neisseria meningitidis]|nr:hypothetical protein A6J51_13705 [Neisseria meningitidis]